MAESIERYFRLMPVGHKQRPSTRLWCPAADVYQTKNGWIVKVELAGVHVEEVEVSIQGASLHISGCRRDHFYGESATLHQLEITYSRFERILRFPCPIEGALLERDYRDGLLILYLRGGENCEETK
ncbi:MAG: Hsp20/alpha crystallin family protein [Pyrinomonadaceae bacterium]